MYAKDQHVLTDINIACKILFCKSVREIENIPPTHDAFEQHVKCAAYQAGHVWGNALIANPPIPSPEKWGWLKGPVDY